MLWQQLKMALARGRRRRLTTLTVKHPTHILFLNAQTSLKGFARSRHVYESIPAACGPATLPTDVLSSIIGTISPVSGNNQLQSMPKQAGVPKKKRKKKRFPT